MVTIDIKQTKIPNPSKEGNGVSTNTDYGDLIKICVKSVSSTKGINIEQMRKRMRILDALEKADGKLKLEDADYTYLKESLATFEWGLVHKDIIEFTDYIYKLKES